MKLHNGVSGIYTLQVFRPDGSLKDEKSSRNIITTVGLRAMYNMNHTGNNPASSGRYSYFYRCMVGSGSPTPSLSDTSLDTLVTSKDSADNQELSISNYDSTTPENSYVAHKFRYDFAQGAAAGNLSEVGVGDTRGNLFSRALILDQSGNPTTITVLSDEYLVVTYEIRFYIFASGAVSGTVDGYTYDIWPHLFNTWGMSTFSATGNSYVHLRLGDGSRALESTPPDITSDYSSGLTSSSNLTVYNVQNLNYDDINHTVVKRITFTPPYGNMTNGIRSLETRSLIGIAQRYFMQFDPPIPKDNTKSLEIDIQFSWGNYTPPV